MRYTFKKEERLNSKKIIAGVMSRGKSFSLNPFRVLWISADPGGILPAQVLFSVPKKKFKTAVQRNRIKRRMREAYRKNKNYLYEKLENSGLKIGLAFIYTSSDESEYKEIESKIILSLHRLAEMVNNHRNL